MKEEKAVKLFQGVTGIGDDLIEEAGTARIRKKISPWRGAAIAACLCAALLGTALAASELAGVWLTDLFNNETRTVNKGWEPEVYSGYVIGGNISLFPLDSLSLEVLEIGETSAQAQERGFLSWEAMEQFVGVDVMNNPVLEAAPGGVRFGIGAGFRSGQYVAAVNVRDGSVPRVVFRGSWLLHPGEGVYGKKNHVNVTLRGDLYTEAYAEKDLSRLWESYYPEGTTVSQEEYGVQEGLTVQIFRVDRPGHDTNETVDITDEYLAYRHGPRTEYTAMFVLNGVLFKLTAEDSADTEVLRDVLLEVLNGFEL